ncbi:MAG: trigger factor, partial [Gammaproteobacteria bacterium]|nr:trigger factor [Gammaproteobacteria bacterium]
MEVTVEILEGLEIKVYVVVPFDRIEEKIREKLEQTAKTAKINGFRPGKVPISEIKRRYGQGIRQEVSGEVIQSSFAEAVQKESLNPAGMPKIDDVKMQENEDLEYTATIEVFPEIELNGLDDIEIE